MLKQVSSGYKWMTGNYLVALFLFIYIWNIPLDSFATNYYLSNSGNDANAGTSPLEPWQTITKLNTIVPAAGDSILFLSENIFRGQVNLTAGGNENQPIYLGTYGGAIPAIISGAEAIVSWSLVSGNIYQATFTALPAHLFVNNRQMTIARYPNSGFLIHQEGIDHSGFVDTALTQPDGYWKGATVRIRTSDRIYEVKTVDSFYSRTVLFSTPSIISIESDFGYYFDNLFSELDTLNEWYYDPANQLLYFYTAIDPNNVNTEASVYDHGLSIQNGSSFVTIENLEFQKQKIDGINGNGFSSGLTIRNCLFRNQGISGINLLAGVSHSKISGSIFHDINCAGIAGKFTASEIDFNQLTNIATVPGYGVAGGNTGFAIDIELSDSVSVTRNIIDSSGAGGIFSGAAHSQFLKNQLDHNVLTLNFFGAIYSYGLQGGSNIFQDNFILNTAGDLASSPTRPLFTGGIYLEFSDNDTVSHNTISTAKAHGVMVVKGSSENLLEKNLVYGCGESQLYISGTDQDTTAGNFVFGNTFYSLRENVNPVLLVSDTISFLPAVFDSNYYFNPYDYFAVDIHVVLPDNLYDYHFTLPQWQNFSMNDEHSTGTFFYRDRFSVADTTGTNLVSNGTFTNNFDGWTNDNPDNISMLLDNSTPLDDGCLKITKPSSLPVPEGSVFANSAAADSGNFYLVHVSTYSVKDGNIGWSILANGGDYLPIAERRLFPFSTERRDYNCVMEVTSSFGSTRLSALINYLDSIVWIDNVTVLPVTGTYEDPTKKSRLFMNPSDHDSTLNFGDTTFFNLNQEIITQQIVLGPYSSAVLIFDSTLILAEPEIAISSHDLSYFPNPIKAGDQLNIMPAPGNLSQLHFSLYDMSGRLVDETQQQGQGSIFQYRLQPFLAPGIYILELTMGPEDHFMKLVVTDQH